MSKPVHPLDATPLELASGFIVGRHEPAAHLPAAVAGASPFAALEDGLLPELRAAPSFVGFSGGRDSSLVLAAAARAARREGLPSPIPITLRFPSPDAEESAWQERVVRHLGLDEWLRVELTDELDYLGELATGLILRHGAIDPPNIHFWLPVFARAHGGVVLTGIGGDDIFLTWRWQRAVNALWGRLPPKPGNLARAALLVGPRALRRRVLSRRIRSLLPAWLRPHAAAAVLETWVADEESQPRRFDRWLDWFLGTRYYASWQHCFGLPAADAGVRVFHPLLEPRFLATVARTGGRTGWPNRTAAMTALFPDSLPHSVLRRPVKAVFDDVFFGPRARAFARSWDGTGVDTELVDPGPLHEEWLKPRPRYQSLLLLQHAWLASRSSDSGPP